MNPRPPVTRTNCSLAERKEASSNNSSGCVAGVEGHEIQGEESGELLSEMCLESMFNGLRKFGNDCGNDCGVRRSHGFSYTPLHGL